MEWPFGVGNAAVRGGKFAVLVLKGVVPGVGGFLPALGLGADQALYQARGYAELAGEGFPVMAMQVLPSSQ